MDDFVTKTGTAGGSDALVDVLGSDGGRPVSPAAAPMPSFLLCQDLASTIACRPTSQALLDWYHAMLAERRIWVHPAVYEARLEGIALIGKTDPSYAARLYASVGMWWRRIPTDRRIQRDDGVVLVEARLRSDSRLRPLAAQSATWRTTRGMDVTLAAAAIRHGLVLATEAPGKPMEIHRHHRVPGIFRPARNIWSVEFRP